MPKFSDEEKYKALSLLHTGQEPRAVAKELKIPVTAILKWNKELKESINEGGMNTLVNMDRVVLGTVIEKVIEEHPGMENEATNLVKQLTYVEKLNEDFHITANHLNARVKAMTILADTPSELIMLAEVLCALQNAFFNSNSTNVNVQNNFGPQSQYSEFLGDKPQC